MSKSYIVFAPSKIFGGTELVYLAIIEELLKQSCNVTIIDMAEGWTTFSQAIKYLDKKRIALHTLNDDIENLNDCITILTSAKFISTVIRWGMSKGFDISENIHAWLLHPTELYSNRLRIFRKTESLWGISKVTKHFAEVDAKKFDYILKELINRNRLVAMDEVTARSFSHLVAHPVICAAPLFNNNNADKQNEYRLDCKDSQELTVVWISRIEGFKVPPLLHLVDTLNLYSSGIKSNVHLFVIGDGESMQYVKKSICINRYLKVTFTGFMQIDELKEKLKAIKPSISVAMGSSAVLTASLSIPTLLACATEIEDMKGLSSNPKVYRLLGAKGLISIGEYSNCKLEKVSYYSLTHFLRHKRLLAKIGNIQKKWYIKNYSKACENYINYINRVGLSEKAPKKIGCFKKIYFRFLNFVLNGIVLKNAKLPF